MKKAILLLLLAASLTAPAFAARWKQLDEETYVDTSRISKDGNYVSVWFKIMNKSRSGEIHNMPVAYDEVNYYVDCDTRRAAVKGNLAVAEDGTVLSQSREPNNAYLIWVLLANNSHASMVYNEACRAR